MKSSFFALFLASVAYAASGNNAAADMDLAADIDISRILSKIGPVVKKAACSAPCIIQTIEKLGCNGKGPIATTCSNIDPIAQSAQGCISKCGVSKQVQNYMVRIADSACKKVDQAKDNSQQDSYKRY